MKSFTGKIIVVMAAVVAAGVVAGLFNRPLLAPWLLSAALFAANLALSLVFFRVLARLSPAAAAGLAMLSLVLRLGLVALGLALVGWLLPGHFAATAVSFLVVYTIFVGAEIAMGLKARPQSGAAGKGSA